MTVSGEMDSRPRRVLGGRAVGAALAMLGGVAAVAIGIRGPETSRESQLIKCVARVIVVDTSSSDRSPALSNLADRVITTAAQSAAVCNDPLSVYGVAGGGSESTIITMDDLSGFAPIGPTAQIRSLRFTSAQRSALGILISTRLRAAYDTGTPSLTSVPALYWVASQYLTQGGQVLMITDGVNEDTQLNLNTPLAVGAGAELARSITVHSLRGATVTIVGLAQVDASAAPPSAVWPSEIRNFNAALCNASGAAMCRLFGLASISESLDS